MWNNRNHGTTAVLDMITQIFTIYLSAQMAAAMDRPAMRGAWEAAVLEQGAQVVPGGVTVRVMPSGRVVVSGRASR